MTFLNLARTNPFEYARNNGITLGCSPPTKYLQEFWINENLQRSSQFQASTLSFNNCTETSHDTCPLYCHQRCYYDDRITSFFPFPQELYNIQEVLTKGPRQPLKILNLLLQSPGHCSILLSNDLNMMGTSFQKNDKNIFVGDFILIDFFPENPFVVGCYNNNQFIVNTISKTNDIYVTINNETSFKMNKISRHFYGLNVTLEVNNYYFHDSHYNSSIVYVN